MICRGRKPQLVMSVLSLHGDRTVMGRFSKKSIIGRRHILLISINFIKVSLKYISDKHIDKHYTCNDKM